VAATIFGVIAITFMMIMYAVESRHRGFILAFALGCALSSTYGFLSGAWPFGVVEGIWTGLAFWHAARPSRSPAAAKPGEMVTRSLLPPSRFAGS
jgi:hypothetical protein